MILEQLDASVVDHMGLFSADRSAEYSAEDVKQLLTTHLGVSPTLDRLALRFRSEFAVPAAERILGSLPA